MNLAHEKTEVLLAAFINQIEPKPQSWRVISIEFQDCETLYSPLFQNLCLKNIEHFFSQSECQIFWKKPGFLLIFFQGRAVPIEKCVEGFLKETEFKGFGRFFDILDLSIDWNTLMGFLNRIGVITEKEKSRQFVEPPEKEIFTSHKKAIPAADSMGFTIQLSEKKIKQMQSVRKARITPLILLVEDDPFTLQLVKLAFKEGFEVITAETVRQALVYYQRHLPDMTFLDIQLPDGNGIELLQQIKKADDDAYIIMLSSHSQKEKIIDCLHNGAKSFIAKPFSRQRLLDATDKFKAQQKNQIRRVIAMELKDILSQMTDYTTDAIVITEAMPDDKFHTPKIVYVNKSFTQLTGYTSAEAIGQSPKFLQGQKTDKKTTERIRQAVDAKRSICAEILNYSKEGQEYWVEININPIFCPHTNECTYFLATERDITERKNAESQLMKAIEKAEAATVAKSEFLANMSHELRTPMNGILGLTEILQSGELTDEVRECVDAIHSSGMGLLSIVNDILDLSKIEAKELEIETYPFKIKDTLKNIKDVTSLSAAHKNLYYDINLNMNVPDWLTGDGKRIQQIIFNLVGNAIKFTEVGGISVSLDWTEINEKSSLVIQVQDTGIGIPDEFHKYLFNKFSQADTSISRKFGGTGLGLAITKYLVEMMGGNIGFTSKLNHGTVFYVTIPINAALKQDILQSEITVCNENSLVGVDLQHLKALIVEDHPINQMLAVKWLKKLGIKNINSALNGFESLTLLRNNNYDFILMDCQMPELDGYETTSLIRDMEKQMNTRTPIIAMTANAMLGEREKCILAGMDDYLSKPLNFNEFQSSIARWVGGQPSTEVVSSDTPKMNTSNSFIPVDLSRLNEFTEGDKDTENMVINLFLETAYESFDRLKCAQLSEEAEEWSKAAHSLKGASGNLGAMALHAICADAEYKGTGTSTEKDIILSCLYSEFSKVETYLKSLN